jgi:o-succinylbenzoate synthase
VLLVEVHSASITGGGEITAGERPFYSPENTDTSWVIFTKFIASLVLGQNLEAVADVPALIRPIRWHEMTKAGFENAVWDIQAQINNVPLAKLLGGKITDISCGVSIGIHNSPAELLKVLEKEVAAGYQRLKLKISPGKDIEVAAAVRKHFPSVPLMVDANCAYQLEDAEVLRRFDDYNLTMIEQPLGWDEIYEHSIMQSFLKTPICLDECIHHVRHARAAIDLRACGVINIKLGRVGAYTEARRIEELCRTRSIPVWCGGMLETGIGRAYNTALSSLPGFVPPGDISASQRYWDEDIIEPEVEVSPQGTIRVPIAPGLGYKVRRNRVEEITARQEHFRAV